MPKGSREWFPAPTQDRHYSIARTRHRIVWRYGPLLGIWLLLEPAGALSLANTILATVGIALGNDEKHQDRAVVEILPGVDMNAALSELLQVAGGQTRAAYDLRSSGWP
jgi:hypothetical protein